MVRKYSKGKNNSLLTLSSLRKKNRGENLANWRKKPLLPKKRISNKSRPRKRNAKSRATKKRWEKLKEQMKAAKESGCLPHSTGEKIKEEITEEWEESILPTRNSNEEINLTEGRSLSNDVENSSPLHIRLDIKIEEEKGEEWEGSESVQDEDVGESNEQNKEGNFPSTAEALSCVKTLKQFFSIHEKQELNLQKLCCIENCLNEIAFKAKKQTKIKD